MIIKDYTNTGSTGGSASTQATNNALRQNAANRTTTTGSRANAVTSARRINRGNATGGAGNRG